MTRASDLMRIRFSARRILLCTLSVVMLDATASAQYFGQNKVQYKRLEFQTLRTEHFDIYFTPGDRVAVDGAARMVERWHERLSRTLLRRLLDRQPLVLYSSHPEFEQTNVVPDLVDEATGGLTEPVGRRIVLPLAGTLADTDHVIGHELVHVFQMEMSADVAGSGAMSRLPLWFVEGMAEYLSLGAADASTAMWLRDAARRDALPSIDDLDNPAYFPYRWGHAFWAYVAGRWGDGVIRRLFVAAAESGVRAATESVLGRSTAALTQEWHAAIRQAYAPVLEVTSTRAVGARVAFGGASSRGDLNVGPAISPDGRVIAFLSGRGIFSVDLYIADAQSGRILRRLTNTSARTHLSSLQFIRSAGAWDAEGRHLAVAAVTGARAALVVFNAKTWRAEREITLPDVDEIFGPTWAPDGGAIAFTGMSGGVMDLYIYDLRSGTQRRVTNDAFADLQPAWSPDGRRIVFATDRFTTRLDTIVAGRYRLALFDIDTNAIAPLGTSTVGDDVNPQWSPDGGAIYFVSNRTGIPNLYRARLDEQRDVEQLTDVATGVSGITSTSPAMSVAAQSGLVALSVYENAAYGTYLVDPAKRGPAIEARAPTSTTLPPIDRTAGELASLVANPTFGLPRVDTFAVSRYSPALTLEGVGGVFLSAGVNPLGVAAQGGATFSFADVLGDRHLATAIQVGSGLTQTFSVADIAGQVAYLDQRRRWNWGVTLGQLPFISGGVLLQTDTTTAQGPVAITQTILFRRVEHSAAGVAAYPLNRATRLEFGGGVSRLSFDRVTETSVSSLLTAELLGRDSETTSLAPPLVMGTGSAALVFDTTNFGATSPVHGQRYRLEAAPAIGTIGFTSMLADYRRYFMPVPFYTIAVRAVHYGRYGGDAEDPRLLPVYIGHPSLVRGYDIVLNAAECTLIAAPACRSSDPLVGSRALVGNLEFRMPLLRPLGLSGRMYGPVPTEIAVFADGGAGWNRGERPSVFGGARPVAASAGLTLRTNIRGFAVAGFTLARPFQRQNERWVFQFTLAPGF
jgi:WD40-like Beta Propeller Repeat/Peptidase of plants and bacteria